MSEEHEWVLVKEFLSRTEAEVVQSLLQSCAIQAKVFGASEAQVLPHLGSVVSLRLMVQRQDLEAASNILNAEVPEQDAPPDWNSPERTVGRAYRAAVYGAVLLPVLMHLYSLFLLFTMVRSGKPLAPELRSKVFVIVFLDFLFMGVWTALLLLMRRAIF